MHLKRRNRDRLARHGGYHAAVDRTGQWSWAFRWRWPARLDAVIRRTFGKKHWSVKRFDAPTHD